MLTNDAIRTSPDIRLYSDKLISVKSLDDNEIYWFCKRGLPWGTRENSSFLSHHNYAPKDGIQITSEAAEQIIHQWTHRTTA